MHGPWTVQRTSGKGRHHTLFTIVVIPLDVELIRCETRLFGGPTFEFFQANALAVLMVRDSDSICFPRLCLANGVGNLHRREWNFNSKLSRLIALTTLIPFQPAVAHASVGELATDVLVATLGAQLYGRLENDNVLPCCGNDAYTLDPPGTLATSLELYAAPHIPNDASSSSSPPRAFILQQRAPTIKGRQRQFCEQLAEWAAACGFGQLLVLAGFDPTFRGDQQLGLDGVSAVRYLASGASPGAATAGMRALEPDFVAQDRDLHGLLPPWPLLDQCDARQLRWAMIGSYASEGDNAPDGLLVAQHALRFLQATGALPGGGGGGGASAGPGADAGWQLKRPCSWVALYGRSFDKTLF